MNGSESLMQRRLMTQSTMLKVYDSVLGDHFVRAIEFVNAMTPASVSASPTTRQFQ